MYACTLEITADTKIRTCNGMEYLIDVLRRMSEQCLWGVKWCRNGVKKGMTFHCTYADLRKCISDRQEGLEPIGCPKYVRVSDWIYRQVEENKNIWVPVDCFKDAEFYSGHILN